VTLTVSCIGMKIEPVPHLTLVTLNLTHATINNFLHLISLISKLRLLMNAMTFNRRSRRVSIHNILMLILFPYHIHCKFHPSHYRSEKYMLYNPMSLFQHSPLNRSNPSQHPVNPVQPRMPGKPNITEDSAMCIECKPNPIAISRRQPYSARDSA